MEKDPAPPQLRKTGPTEKKNPRCVGSGERPRVLAEPLNRVAGVHVHQWLVNTLPSGSALAAAQYQVVAPRDTVTVPVPARNLF